jgi:predicted lysophospholipase L1 biosynthesis ABC-type transport system permease subunit
MKVLQLMEVLGYLMIRMISAYCGAVPGFLIGVIAALPLASPLPPATATTLSVFELFVRSPGLKPRLSWEP